MRFDFGSMSNITNSSVPRFPCQYCDKRFKRLDHVQRHERRHTKEAPYKCACGQAYPRRYVVSQALSSTKVC